MKRANRSVNDVANDTGNTKLAVVYISAVRVLASGDIQLQVDNLTGLDTFTAAAGGELSWI